VQNTKTSAHLAEPEYREYDILGFNAVQQILNPEYPQI
jgi:hypothetical protein